MSLISPFFRLFLVTVAIGLQGDCKDNQIDGFEFVFAIPFIHQSPSPRVVITTSSYDPVYVSLSVPGIEFKVKTNVSRYRLADIVLSTSARVERGTGIYNKTIIVRSSDHVLVHGFDNEYGWGDGFFVLPSSQLGTEYRVASYVPFSASYPSFFCVSALAEETTVKIRTKAGQSRTFLLQPYQSLRFEGGGSEDLTATVVQADKDISVISGVRANVPANVCCNDGLLEMLPPVHSWGTNFVLAPFIERESGYLFRVLSTNQTTSVTISDIGNIQIQGDEWYEGNVNDESVMSIMSDLPVMVVQYIRGRGSDSSNHGDPSMQLVPPMKSYSNNITFPVQQMTQNEFNYYINIIINCSFVDGLVYNNTIPMTDWDLLKTSDNTMCVLRGPISTGVQSIGHIDQRAKFAVSVYAFYHSSSSYAYPAGFALQKKPQEAAKPPLDPVWSDVSGLTLYCCGTNMTAILNSSVVPFTQASDVHMLDEDCVASDYGVEQAIISTSYNGCKTIMEESESHIVFRNALMGQADPDSPIIQHYVNIECRIERRHMTETSYLSDFKTHVSFGNFSFELEIFPDATYSAPYGTEDYPIDLKVGDILHLAANVITVNNLDLFIDRCWATPTADPWSDTDFSLILNGCADDDTVVFYDSNEPTSKRFSFHAFRFKGENRLVFVHCQLLVCDAGTQNSRCEQGCVESPLAIPPRTLRSVSDLHTVTSEPVVVRG